MCISGKPRLKRSRWNRNVTLTEAKSGQTVKVESIMGGQMMVKKAMDLGLRPGVVLVVVQNAFRGQMVVKIEDLKLGIGRGIAVKIVVEPVKR